MEGKKSLTEREKEVLRNLVLWTCEVCHKGEEEVGKLTPHRIKRGNQGGTYAPRNIQMVCDSCHKKLHGKEEGTNEK